MSTNKLKGTPMDRAIAAAFMAKVPPMLWGSPGIGKSAYTIALGKMFKCYTEVMLASIRENTDFLGLPIERNGQVDYVPGAWVNRLNSKKAAHDVAAASGGSLLFLDEITTVDESTMKGALRVVNEGWVGEVELEKHVQIMLAGNDPDEAVDGIDLPAPMANRLLHLDFKLDAERWRHGLQFGWDSITLPPLQQLVYADPVSRRSIVASAVSKYTMRFAVEDALNPPVPEDASAAGKAWASPRTWTMLVDVLSYVQPNDRGVIQMVAEGLIGSKHAAGFCHFLREQDLVDPMEVIKGNLTLDWKTVQPDQAYVLCNSMASIAKADKQYHHGAMRALIECGIQNTPDIAQMGIQTLASISPIPADLQKDFERAFKGMLSHSAYRVVEAV